MSPEYSVRAVSLALTDPIFKCALTCRTFGMLIREEEAETQSAASSIVVSYCWQTRLCFECGLLSGQGAFGTVPGLY